MPIDLTEREGIYVLAMRNRDNRMNRRWLDAMDRALDEVESDAAAHALVTVGEGKFFSNGLDLDWLMSDGAEPMPGFVADVERVFARVLGFPLITVAACNGHAFAAGAMFALCHDFRVMRADRGYFCLPEVDIKIPFTAGMDALIRSKLSAQTAHEAMVTGKRYGGAQAQGLGIVDRAVEEEAVLDEALQIASDAGGKDRVPLGTIKGRMYGPVLELLSSSDGTQPL